jgi:hypothetical protein
MLPLCASVALTSRQMTHLFVASCFSPSVDDLERDKVIFRRFSSLQFLTPANLDINERHNNPEKFQSAIDGMISLSITNHHAPVLTSLVSMLLQS